MGMEHLLLRVHLQLHVSSGVSRRLSSPSGCCSFLNVLEQSPDWLKFWWLTLFSEPGGTISVTGMKQIMVFSCTGHASSPCYPNSTICAQHSIHVCYNWVLLCKLTGCSCINKLGTRACSNSTLGHKVFGHACMNLIAWLCKN